MTYKIKFASKIEKFLSKVGKRDLKFILEKIESLKTNPRLEGSAKLKGKKSLNLYRVRAGNYRIVYSIIDEKLLILIVTIGDRKDIYRSL